MKLIKLDAINSTNEFLKGISTQQNTENFTVVTAENQTNGKGQRGAVWNSEVGKNLIMSVLVKDFLIHTNAIFNLNIVFSLAVISTLKKKNIPDLSIKWPNDILSANKKIGGILIENSIKSDGSIHSIVGLGLNVNQTNFDRLPKASSLAEITGIEFFKEDLLLDIITNLEKNVTESKNNPEALRQQFVDLLYKKDFPMPFTNQKEEKFMGIIQGISPIGRLRVLLEDDSVAEFDIKEIQMLY
jgi:BirA family biotin operon repressor/biotin-[acetyl-CoA-carboxylase] ligase